MANTPFADLYKTDLKDTKLKFYQEMGTNVDKIDTKLKGNSDNISLKANKALEAWITATLQNGWTGTFQYAKNDLGQVSIEMTLGTGVVANRTIITTLPVGYRPRIGMAFVVYKANTPPYDTNIGIAIDPNGSVRITDPIASTLTASSASASLQATASYISA